MAFTHLPFQQIIGLRAAVKDAGLATSRQGLFSGIDEGFRLAIPVQQTPIEQVATDLQRLNQTERLVDGTVPLEIWLMNAIDFATDATAAAVLQEALSSMTNRGSAATDWEAPADLPEYEEAVVHEDDKLPFSFLEMGRNAGQSVAKLRVPRIENGVPSMNGVMPRRYLGTGWLIGPNLLMTNRHVIAARDRGEPAASANDLELQAKGTVVQFGYDTEGEEGVEIQVGDLLAEDTELDYALLRLAASPGHEPLRLATESMSVPEGHYPSVNIIQHPGGKPKEIAVRNNLVTQITTTDLRYFTDTDRGSSGSPVFDDTWTVVGLHRAASKAKQPLSFQGRQTAVVNVGTPITAIAEHLETNHRSVWQEITG